PSLAAAAASAGVPIRTNGGEAPMGSAANPTSANAPTAGISFRFFIVYSRLRLRDCELDDCPACGSALLRRFGGRSRSVHTESEAKLQRFRCEVAGGCAQSENEEDGRPVEKFAARCDDRVDRERSLDGVPNREGHGQRDSENACAQVKTDVQPIGESIRNL